MHLKGFFFTEGKNKKALLIMKAGLFKLFLHPFYFQ